jgi:hypothetical protein
MECETVVGFTPAVNGGILALKKDNGSRMTSPS